LISALAKIRHMKNEFTNSEKKVAEFIEANSFKVIGMTLNEFAQACKVSEATIVRFIRKIGFETFQSLKFSLAKEETHSFEIDEIAILPNDEPAEVVKKITSGCIRTIQNTYNVTNIDEYLRLAHVIRSARRIEIYGVGSSGAVALLMQYKLVRSGYPAIALIDPHMQSFSATLLSAKDLAIAVSQSGSTKDTVDSLEIAKNHGAVTAAITDHKNSPIAQHASIIIETFSSENPIDTSAGRSVLAQVYAIEILIGILHILDYEHCKMYGDETAKSVLKKLY